ncbi:hypothetical protein J4212_06330 [Candidatus Woesearchaeota archaeon]|nr:hypothetical protein [Candidatus Woesearchaeota archaeon]
MTEIVTGIEVVILFKFRDFFIGLMNIENDRLGIKYAIVLGLVAIPIISAGFDYQTKQRQISNALYHLFGR